MDTFAIGSYAGFSRRCGAFLVDIIPITAIVVAMAYQFSDLDDVFLTHVRDRNNLPATARFLMMQKAVNESSFVIYILYSAIMESSRHQATVGKILFRMRVINAVGGRLVLRMPWAGIGPRSSPGLPCVWDL